VGDDDPERGSAGFMHETQGLVLWILKGRVVGFFQKIHVGLERLRGSTPIYTDDTDKD
jgi:hypothetical protein